MHIVRAMIFFFFFCRKLLIWEEKMLPGKLILISGYKGRCVDQSCIITQGFGWGCNCLIYDKDAGFLFVIQTYCVNVYSSEHMSITVLNKYHGQFTFFFSLFNFSITVNRRLILYLYSVSMFCILSQVEFLQVTPPYRLFSSNQASVYQELIQPVDVERGTSWAYLGWDLVCKKAKLLYVSLVMR